jgi:hypothetical protein
MIKSMLVACAVVLLSACTSQYPNQQVTGKQFPSISGESLEKNMVIIPSDFKADKTLILIGYKQDSQFDIDRWLIGLDMAGITLPTYELPTIAGMAPRMFSSFIDSGMRKGIPKELWGGVITIYNDGEAVQKFTGNQRPNNSRVVLIDSNGKILYFYDRGFSVDALNKLKARIE